MKGETICTFYTNYGTCKYGTACKYDHPVMGYYNYTTLPSFSYPQPPAVFPNARISQVMWTSSDDSSSNTMKVPNEVVKSGRSYEVHELNISGNEDPSTPTSPAPNDAQLEPPQNQSNWHLTSHVLTHSGSRMEILRPCITIFFAYSGLGCPVIRAVRRRMIVTVVERRHAGPYVMNE